MENGSDEVKYMMLGIIVVYLIVTQIILKNIKGGRKKKKTWIITSIGFDILMFLYIVILGIPIEIIIIMLPMMVLVTYLGLRSRVFCEECGKAYTITFKVERPEKCSKCGAKLI